MTAQEITELVCVTQLCVSPTEFKATESRRSLGPAQFLCHVSGFLLVGSETPSLQQMTRNGALDPVTMGDDSHFAALPPTPSTLGAGNQGQYLGTPTKICGNSARKGWPLHSQFVLTTWLKNISWKCTFTVFIDLSSDGLQLVGSEACLKHLTSIQANGICFAILNNKEISSINKEQGKPFPESLLDPCVQQGIR